MSGILGLLTVVLSSAGLAALVWGLRQRAVLDRVHAGLRTLQEGGYDIRLRREAGDTEAVLQSFDALAQILGARRTEAAGPAAAMEQLLPRLAEVLRPSLLSIQAATTRLLGEASDPGLATQLLGLRLQVANLLGVFDTAGDWSAFRRGLSALRRDVGPDAASSPAVLVVGPEGPAAESLCQRLGTAGMDALVAPGKDAVLALAAALRPPIVLFDAAWHRSWLIALRFVQSRPALACPWLYTATDSNGGGRLWTPRDLWFWPRSDAARTTGDDWLQTLAPGSLTVAGPPALAAEVGRALANRGLTVATTNPGPAEAAWVTVRPTAAAEALTATDYLLVFPQIVAETEPERICQAFAATGGPSGSHDLVHADRLLVERLLAPLGTARSDPGRPGQQDPSTQ